MTKYTLLTLTVVLFLCNISPSPASAISCNKRDRAALLVFKDSFLDNPFSHSFPDWTANSTNDCCHWDYIGCDSNTGRVTSLTLSSNSFDPPDIFLNGTIPPSIGDLTALESLTLASMPDLVGPIPSQLSKLKMLKKLSIHDCKISGSVPSFLSQLPSLQQLDLGNNMLVGTIPPSLANLANLSSLNLHDNQLTGAIPPNLFGKLAKPSSVFLYLSDNNLKGTIPQSLANVDFFACYLDNNKLEGDASLLFGRNKTISSLSVYSNNFRFDLSNVEYPLALTYLDISRNEIYGSISNQITQVPDLTFVVFSHNNLCGKIPSGGHFQTFRAVYFEHNKCLCGAPLKPCK